MIVVVIVIGIVKVIDCGLELGSSMWKMGVRLGSVTITISYLDIYVIIIIKIWAIYIILDNKLIKILQYTIK